MLSVFSGRGRRRWKYKHFGKPLLTTEGCTWTFRTILRKRRCLMTTEAILSNSAMSLEDWKSFHFEEFTEGQILPSYAVQRAVHGRRPRDTSWPSQETTNSAKQNRKEAKQSMHVLPCCLWRIQWNLINYIFLLFDVIIPVLYVSVKCSFLLLLKCKMITLKG